MPVELPNDSRFRILQAFPERNYRLQYTLRCHVLSIVRVSLSWVRLIKNIFIEFLTNVPFQYPLKASANLQFNDEITKSGFLTMSGGIKET